MDSITIRSADAGDAAALSLLLGQLGYPSDAEEIPGRLQKLYSRPGSTVLVAVTASGQVIAAVTEHLFQALHTTEPTAWLTAVVVEENERGRGVGAEIVEYAERWAAEHGARKISLTSATRRQRAHQFYRNHGYEQTGVRLAKDLIAPATDTSAPRPDQPSSKIFPG
jgi:GNAT superfamily N-acetyltransferase